LREDEGFNRILKIPCDCFSIKRRLGLILLEILWFLENSTRIGFNRYIYLCAFFEFSFFTLLVRHNIVDPNLPIQIVGTIDLDLCGGQREMRIRWLGQLSQNPIDKCAGAEHSG
jgi:hypothetical protein